MSEQRPPLPPFTAETAAQKARLAEGAWNSRDPARVALAYTTDSRWRNRAEFLQGRAAIETFLTRKWQRELDYRLIKEAWCSQIQGVRRDLDKTVRVDVDRVIGDVSADKLNAVFLPGSAVNADTMKPRVQAFPQVMQAARKTFAVSCHALWEPASA
jgi:putative intracellular protease/amidase